MVKWWYLGDFRDFSRYHPNTLLIIIFINDLPDNIVFSIKLHADDVLITEIAIESEYDHSIFQQDLNKL